MRRCSLPALLLVGTAAGAVEPPADAVWLVGGGPDVYASQVQIEANVLWARRVVAELPGRRTPMVWFTDGQDPAPDVVEWRDPPESALAMQPFARVMDSAWANGQSYRNHRVPAVRGGTSANALVRDLRSELRGLSPGRGAWLIFNGHGSLAEDRNNSIELWDNTRLRVDDLAALLDLAPPDSPVRFLFTQCYAGAFARLAQPGTQRCGFVAEAADREAEGCSAALEQAGFQDYSTHFFAALAGRNRDGSPLVRDPDRDRDGRVSPLEAHYHTLVSARSSDLPRATSEMLLEQWDAWYLSPAVALFGNGENRYTRLAWELMQRVGVGEAELRQGGLAALRQQTEREFDRLRQELERTQERVESLRAALEAQVLRRWPRCGYAYTLNYRRFLQEDLASAQAFIQSHPGYPELIQGQERVSTLDRDLLDLERDLTGLEKIRHLLRLSRVLEVLETLGPAALRAHYHALLACESASF